VVAVDAKARTFDLQLASGFPSPTLDYFASGEIKLQYYNSDAMRTRIRGQAGFTPVAVGPLVAVRTYRMRLLRNWGLPRDAPPPVSGALRCFLFYY
jgi:hypothetical protein